MPTQVTPVTDDLAVLHGFIPSGDSDNVSALTAYITAAAGEPRVLVFTEGDYLFDGGSAVEVPENIQIECRTNAMLRVDNATIVRLTGVFDAPPMHVITLTAGGQVSMYGNTELRPEWWGAVADGVTDCSAAFDACLLAGPYREGVWSNGAALKSNCQFVVKMGSGRVAFPSESGYLFSSPLVFPNYRSIHFDGGGRHGARVINGTGTDWVWKVEGTFNSFQWVALTFDGIVFDRGGLKLRTDAANINHSSQGGRIVRDCTFYGAPDYAIEVGQRYVWGWIERCTFDSCGGGVHFAERDSDLWRVTNCSFLRETTYPSVMVRSSGVTISECDFEVRSGTGLEQPFIGVGYPCTDLRVLHNRFGSEPTHPVSAIDFGEDGDDTALDPMLGIMVKGNQFKGYSTPSDTIAAACFRFYKPVSRSQFIGNQIWSYKAVVQELYADLGTQYGRYSYDNLWRENQTTFYSGHQLDRSLIFSDGGIGWHTDLTGTVHGVKDVLNYTPTPDVSSASWLKAAAASVSASGTGPDGFITAYSLNRTAGGSCYAYTNLVSVPEGEKLTFSVWAKAGSLTKLRLYAIDQANRAVSSFSEIFSLSEEWKQYHITLEVPPAGTSYRFYIYNGADGTSDTSGDILICDPRVDVGDTPYMPSYMQTLDYIDLSDYRTINQDFALNHTNAFLLGMAHAVAAGRKLRVTPGRTWYCAFAQPVSGVHIDARGASINGGTGTIFADALGGKYRIEGGSWTNCLSVFTKSTAGTSLVSCQFVRMGCSSTSYAFDVDESINSSWEQCSFSGSGQGIRLKSASQNNINSIINCQFQNLTGPAVVSLGDGEPNADLAIERCWFENITNEAIEISGTRAARIQNCYFESNGSANTYDIDLHSDSGGQTRHVTISECYFATPDAAQTVQRIGLRGQTQANIERCVAFLNSGQVFIAYAVSNVYVSEFHRNYLSGTGTYRDALFTDTATNDPHWSAFVSSGGVTDAGEQMYWAGRYQAAQLAHWASAVSTHTGAGTLVTGRINRVDPTAGPYTLDLPASPKVGDAVGIKNVTTDTTIITIDGNGNNVEGAASIAFSGSRAKLTLYWDGTEWVDL